MSKKTKKDKAKSKGSQKDNAPSVTNKMLSQDGNSISFNKNEARFLYTCLGEIEVKGDVLDQVAFMRNKIKRFLQKNKE